jgi:hypothetical protein
MSAKLRLTKAYDAFTQGAQALVAARMEKQFGRNWRSYASAAKGGPTTGPLDAYGLLKTMIDNWRDVFSELPRATRNHVSLALDGRNAMAHAVGDVPPLEALRALDAIAEALTALGAKTQAAQVRTLHKEQMSETGGAAPAAAEPAQRDLLDQGTVGKLKPWREVAIPHPDVLESRFKQSEFAADLTAVDLGLATEEYQDPTAFYRITFVTEGMRKVLSLAAERLSGEGGEPVVLLQTAFGGGKTHTMLSIMHMAASENPRLLPGLEGIIGDGIAAKWKAAKRYVLVGTGLGAKQRLSRENEPPLYTPWGVMGWRLAGQSGLDIVAEAEKQKSAPGSETLVKLLQAAAPCLILFDELVAYARVLDEHDFNHFLNFMQSLTEAAKMVPGVLVVGSLIESEMEAGNQKGIDALGRLSKIFGRVQSGWIPASMNESYEIIRRRLFQELDAEGARSRDATVASFHKLYRDSKTDFPSEVSEAAYKDTLALSYPIHPELFLQLSATWGPLERFQKTRGVLRLMANVVYALWRRDDQAPLILPSSLPLTDERVRASILDPLQGQYASILDAEVEGDQARPQQIEARRTGYGRTQALTRAARAVFVATAPQGGAGNVGITGPRLRLSCATPADQINIFGDALRELSETSAYLYRDGDRYWFATTPTLNRLAAEKAQAYDDRDVDLAIAKLLQDEVKPSGGFSRVHAAADDPTGVEDERGLGLVIFDARSPHSRGGESKALLLAADVLERRGSGQRLYRNVLLFVAADEGRLPEAKNAVRKWMAWRDIVKEADGALQLPPAQKSEAARKDSESREAARRAVRNSWTQLIAPAKADSAGPNASRGFELHPSPIQNAGDRSIAEAAYDKARRDDAIAEKLGAKILENRINDLIGVADHLSISDLLDWSARYIHMKRVRDETVLARAIEDLVAALDGGYAIAARYDAGSDRFYEVKFNTGVFVDLRAGSLLVKRSRAEKDVLATSAASSLHGEGGTATPNPPGQPVVAGPTSRPKPTKFYGTIALDPTRPGPVVAQIAQSVLAELARSSGATIKLRIDIEAENPSGFSEDVVEVIRANAETLKFGESGFD